jgi:uncharacterized protein (TIGR02391 family)
VALQPFPEPVVDRLAHVIGEAFTHARLTELLAQARVVVVDDGPRWLRMKNAMLRTQERDGSANGVAQLVRIALNPAHFLGSTEAHEPLRTEVNRALSMVGLAIGANGELRTIAPAATLDEAAERAEDLRAELRRRGVHGEVLKYCRAELVDRDYFHAVLEAAKSVLQKVRDLTGLTDDGVGLIDTAFAFSGATPYLAVNGMRTESEKSEQRGLADLCRGLVRTFRNPTAHDPRIHAQVERT